MNSNVVVLGEVGSRLRDERTRLGLNQSEMAERGGVTRNAQGSYELGKRACDANYLVALGSYGVDLTYVLTGARGGGELTEDAHELLDCFYALTAIDQGALLQLARSLAGRTAASQRVHTPPKGFAPAPAIRGFAEKE